MLIMCTNVRNHKRERESLRTLFIQTEWNQIYYIIHSHVHTFVSDIAAVDQKMIVAQKISVLEIEAASVRTHICVCLHLFCAVVVDLQVAVAERHRRQSHTILRWLWLILWPVHCVVFFLQAMSGSAKAICYWQ